MIDRPTGCSPIPRRRYSRMRCISGEGTRNQVRRDAGNYKEIASAKFQFATWPDGLLRRFACIRLPPRIGGQDVHDL